MVAFGDADFASNALLAFQGNRDFFLNTVAWLAEDADLISIRAEGARGPAAVPDRSQQQSRGLVSPCSLPGLFVVLGVVELVAAALEAGARPLFWNTYVAVAVARRPGRVHLLRREQERDQARREGRRRRCSRCDKAKVKELTWPRAGQRAEPGSRRTVTAGA